MNSIAIGFIVFARCFGGALFGMFLSTRSRAPSERLLCAPPLRISLGSVLCGSGDAGYVTKVQYPIGPPSNRIKHEIFISLPRLLSHQSLR